MASSSRSSSTLTPDDDPADVKTRQAGGTGGTSDWRPKHYVLAGMAIILAASTVTMVTSVVLRPARIQFSVANFTMANTDNAQVAFDFSISAYNPSRRAGVTYRDVVVSLQLQRHGHPSVRKTSVPGTVRDHLPLSQGRNASRSMGVNGTIDNELFLIYSNASSVSTIIMVIAQVRFNVGLVKSRLYSIRVLCTAIDNLRDQMPRASANCSA